MKYIFYVLGITFSLSAFASTIEVGATKAVKDLNKIIDGNEYVLDPGTYSIKPVTIKKSLTIRSADVNNRATIQFPNAWKSTNSSGPDVGSNLQATINCLGKCSVQDIKTTGGEMVVVLTSSPGAVVLAQHILMDGGGIIRSTGAKSISILNVQSSGKPHAYFIANFEGKKGNRADEILIDLTANTLPVQQGGWCKSGKPTCSNSSKDPAQGESAIRIMDTKHLVVRGLNTKAWLYDGKHIWKQVEQWRGPSGLYEIFNSHLVFSDIGKMRWQNPAPVLKEIRFIDCIIDKKPELTGGLKKLVYQNSKVEGKVLNQTTNF